MNCGVKVTCRHRGGRKLDGQGGTVCVGRGLIEAWGNGVVCVGTGDSEDKFVCIGSGKGGSGKGNGARISSGVLGASCEAHVLFYAEEGFAQSRNVNDVVEAGLNFGRKEDLD